MEERGKSIQANGMFKNYNKIFKSCCYLLEMEKIQLKTIKKYKVQDKVYKKIIFVQYRGDYRKPKEFERKNDIKRL